MSTDTLVDTVCGCGLTGKRGWEMLRGKVIGKAQEANQREGYS